MDWILERSKDDWIEWIKPPVDPLTTVGTVSGDCLTTSYRDRKPDEPLSIEPVDLEDWYRDVPGSSDKPDPDISDSHEDDV